MTNIYKKLPISLKASFWFIFATFFNRAIGIMTTPVYTRILSKSDYGIISNYSAWAGIISIVVTLSIASNAFVKGLVDYENDKGNFISSMITISFLMVGIFFLVFLAFNDFIISLTNIDFKYFMIMIPGLFLNVVIGFWTLEKKMYLRYKKVIYYNILIAIFSQTLTLYVLVTFNLDYAFYKVLLNALPSYLFSILILINMVKKYGVSFNTKYIRYAFAFCIPLVPYYLSNHLLNQVDRVMITDLLGFESNAIYSVAYTASTVSIILWSSISGVLIPYLYRNLKSDDEKSVKKIVTMVVAIFSIITILISLLSPEIMFILGPKSYSIGRMYIPIIVNGIFFSILGTIVSTLILYFKSSINMVLITIISASLNILLNTLLIPYVGVIGAALSTFISYFFMASLYMLYFYFKFNKHFLPSINIIALSLFTILLSFSSYFFMENLFIRLILIILLTFSIIFVTKQTLKKILIKQEVNHS